MAETKHLITMMQKNATGGYDTFYPKTIASQVFIDDTTTVADHIADTSKHLTAEERERLSKAGQANGFAVLDENGFIPSKNINPSVLAINTEFANIAAMKAADINKIYAGELVMVTDASEDPTVESGWAIYRRLTNACYDGLPVAMAEDVTKFVVQAEQPAIESLKVGDFWYQTTGTTEI